LSVAVSIALIVTLFCATAAALAVVALWSRKRRSAREPLALVGRAASVAEPLSPEGSVLVGGELWPALSDSGRHVGRGRANVRVVGARGHLLVVAECSEVGTGE
jgi:membrane-bound ClpP family serine protease